LEFVAKKFISQIEKNWKKSPQNKVV